MQNQYLDITKMPKDVLFITLKSALHELNEIEKANNYIAEAKSVKVNGLKFFCVLIAFAIFTLLMAIFWLLSQIVSLTFLLNYVTEEFAVFFYIIFSLAISIIITGLIDNAVFNTRLARRNEEILLIDDNCYEYIRSLTYKRNLIPERYKNQIALYTMLDILETGRADSWKECANKFEEQTHLNQIEKKLQGIANRSRN